MKIQWRLMLMIVPVLVTIFVITSFTTAYISTKALEIQARDNAKLLSKSYSTELDLVMKRYIDVSLDLSNAVITSINIETTLQIVHRRHHRFSHIFYTPSSGTILEMTPYQPQYLNFDLKSIKGWHEAYETRLPVVSSPGDYFGAPSIIIFTPALFSFVLNQKPTVVGIIAIVLPLEQVFVDLKTIKIGQTGSLFVIDQQGHFLLHKDKTKVLHDTMESLSNNNSLTPVTEAMVQQKTGFASFSDKKGRRYISFAPIPTVRWSLGVYGSYAEINSKTNFIFYINLCIIIAGIILTTIIVYFTTHSVVYPIEQLTDMAAKIQEGDFNQVVAVNEVSLKRVDEIFRLTTAFNNMTKNLSLMFTNLNNQIGERKRVEKSLKRAQNYITDIVNSMPSLLIGIDTEGIITHWNHAAELRTTIPTNEAVGKIFTQLYPHAQELTELINRSIQSQEISHKEKFLYKIENEIHYDTITVYPLTNNSGSGVVIRIDDVTEKVRIEEMMVQSEKMLSVGGLAAGMAHEINNPLAGMIQTAQVISMRLTNFMDTPTNRQAAIESKTTVEAIAMYMNKRNIPRLLTSMNECGERVAKIVTNMLSFARKSENQKSSYMINDIIDATLQLAGTDYDLKKQYDFKLIDIIKDYALDLPMVLCENSKIQQVLLNVFRNGAQAMQYAAVKKPSFIVKTYRDDKQGMVCISIKDTGIGMSEDVSSRIFEPFFTTKPVGEGTGLGLSVSYFIITENHGGEMSVFSEPGKGSTFIIKLPT